MKCAAPLVAIAATVSCLPGPLLAQEDPFRLEGLVITAAPTPRAADDVASHVTVIDADDLRAFGDAELGDVLRAVAAVDVARNGSFGAVTSLFLRGGESDYTLVLVDGVQVNQAGGGFDFASLTAANVERIEVVRGPASALYGSDAVTGVINVVTRTGRGAPRGSMTVEGGSFGRRDWVADFTAGTDRAAYAFALSRHTTDGILDFNNGRRATVLAGRARFMPDEATEVGVTVRASEMEYHYPTDGSGAVVDRNAYTFSNTMVALVTAGRVVSRRLSLEARVGFSERDGGADDAQDGPADTLGFYGFASLDHYRRTQADVRAHVRFARAMVTAGLEVEDQRQRSFSESLGEFGPSTGRSSSSRGNRAAFAHVTGDVRRASLSAGARLEDNDRFGHLVTWQAGISTPVPRIAGSRLRASAGRAIKEPTFTENFATGFAVGNPDLRPERSTSWEVGVEQRISAGVVARATYFDQSFGELIQFTFVPPSPSAPSFYNVAAARARGVETELSVRLTRFEGGIAHAWLDTEVTDSGFDDGPGATFVNGEALLRRPGTRWTVRASAELTPWASAFARLTTIGARSDRDFATFPATPVVLPGYRLVSVGGVWTAMRDGGLSLTLRVENLLGERYEEVLGFLAPGRGLYLRVRIGVG